MSDRTMYEAERDAHAETRRSLQAHANALLDEIASLRAALAAEQQAHARTRRERDDREADAAANDEIRERAENDLRRERAACAEMRVLLDMCLRDARHALEVLAAIGMAVAADEYASAVFASGNAITPSEIAWGNTWIAECLAALCGVTPEVVRGWR